MTDPTYEDYLYTQYQKKEGGPPPSETSPKDEELSLLSKTGEGFTNAASGAWNLVRHPVDSFDKLVNSEPVDIINGIGRGAASSFGGLGTFPYDLLNEKLGNIPERTWTQRFNQAAEDTGGWLFGAGLTKGLKAIGKGSEVVGEGLSNKLGTVADDIDNKALGVSDAKIANAATKVAGMSDETRLSNALNTIKTDGFLEDLHLGGKPQDLVDASKVRINTLQAEMDPLIQKIRDFQPTKATPDFDAVEKYISTVADEAQPAMRQVLDTYKNAWENSGKTFGDMLDQRTKAYNQANYTNATPEDANLNQIRIQVGSAFKDAAEEAANGMIPEQAGKFANLNNKISSYLLMQPFLKTAKEAPGFMESLKDVGSAVRGGLVGGGIAALGMPTLGAIAGTGATLGAAALKSNPGLASGMANMGSDVLGGIGRFGGDVAGSQLPNIAGMGATALQGGTNGPMPLQPPVPPPPQPGPHTGMLSETQQPDGSIKLLNPMDVMNYDRSGLFNKFSGSSINRAKARAALRRDGTVITPEMLPPRPQIEYSQPQFKSKEVAEGFDKKVPVPDDTNQVGATNVNINHDDEGQLKPLIHAIIKQESNWNSGAVNKKSGASGLMQIMPTNFKPYGVSDPFDAQQNIAAGTKILQEGLRAFHGDVELALASYNHGIGNVRKLMKDMKATTYAEIESELPKETREYVPKVMANLSKKSPSMQA